MGPKRARQEVPATLGAEESAEDEKLDDRSGDDDDDDEEDEVGGDEGGEADGTGAPSAPMTEEEAAVRNRGGRRKAWAGAALHLAVAMDMEQPIDIKYDEVPRAALKERQTQ